jgi:small GTP-binding protein
LATGKQNRNSFQLAAIIARRWGYEKVPLQVKMDHLLDPIKVIIVGGCSCGKTTLLKRYVSFAGRYQSINPAMNGTQLNSSHLVPFTDLYEATPGLNIGRLALPLNNGAVCNVSLIDVGGVLIQRKDPDLMNKIIENIEGVFIVVDATSVQSMKDADNWLDILSKCNSNISKFLFVNKSDLPIEQRVVTPQNLDTFVRLGYSLHHV